MVVRCRLDRYNIWPSRYANRTILAAFRFCRNRNGTDPVLMTKPPSSTPTTLTITYTVIVINNNVTQVPLHPSVLLLLPLERVVDIGSS